MADLQENLSGTRVVAANNRQPFNNVKHRNIVGGYRKANLYTAHIGGVYGHGAQFIGVLAQGVVLIVGGTMVLDGKLNIGEFTAFMLYLTRLFAPIQQLAQLYNTYQQGGAAISKLRDLFATMAVGPREAGCDRAPADRRRDPPRGRDVRVLARHDRARARRPHDRSGGDVRAGRPDRRRQVDDREAAHALLRPAVGTRARRRLRRQRRHAALAAPTARHRAPGVVPVRRHHRRQHPVREPRHHARGRDGRVRRRSGSRR